MKIYLKDNSPHGDTFLVNTYSYDEIDL